MGNFWEAYKHPQWQKRRLEVMQKAGFKCEECGGEDATLNVHHKFYVKGRQPWQYADAELLCLCDGCHERFHEYKQELLSLIGTGGCRIEVLVGYARAAASADVYTEPGVGDPIRVESVGVAFGVADRFGLVGDDVLRMAGLDDGKLVHHQDLQLGWYGRQNWASHGLVSYAVKWQLSDRGFTEGQIVELINYENLATLCKGGVIKLSDGRSFMAPGLEHLTEVGA